MGYRAVSRIKDGEDGYTERGDEVKKSDFSEKDWEDLKASGVVVTDHAFNALFPNYGEEEPDEAEEEEPEEPTKAPTPSPTPAPTPSPQGGSGSNQT